MWLLLLMLLLLLLLLVLSEALFTALETQIVLALSTVVAGALVENMTVVAVPQWRLGTHIQHQAVRMDVLRVGMAELRIIVKESRQGRGRLEGVSTPGHSHTASSRPRGLWCRHSTP